MHYATSDTHLDHAKVLTLNNRPFSTLAEFEDHFFKQANALPDNATLYILGDFVVQHRPENLRRLLNRFKPALKLVFTPGNHDHRLSHVFAEYGQTSPIIEIKHFKRKVVLSHMPMTEWNQGHHGAIHLFGHCHGRYKHHGKSLDIGWDTQQRIYSLDEAIALADQNPIFQPCHSQNNGLLHVPEKRY
jgi:calcineurin-like phosphoesterase family protein